MFIKKDMDSAYGKGAFLNHVDQFLDFFDPIS